MTALQARFKVITCPEWGALEPRHGFASIIWTPGPAKRILFHHTAGHHPEIHLPLNESHLEALLYARSIQHTHMSPSATDPSKPWNDSGHNFLVCRNGDIFQGRWRTVRAIQHNRMVVSAHCPRQNDQIGVEHEHFGEEEMTSIQKSASAWLQAWIARQYGRDIPLPAEPHSKYFNTRCPGNLTEDILVIQHMAGRLLARGNV